MQLYRIPASGHSPAGPQSIQNVWVLPAISRDDTYFESVLDDTFALSAVFHQGKMINFSVSHPGSTSKPMRACEKKQSPRKKKHEYPHSHMQSKISILIKRATRVVRGILISFWLPASGCKLMVHDGATDPASRRRRTGSEFAGR